MFAPIRVLVVDDSALIRQMLTRALSVDPRIEVVGVASDGVQAIEKALELDPDVITLDIEMPELSGLEALPHIIKKTEARVIMLSTLDDPETTYQALSLGAVDFIPKPKKGFASNITDLAELLIKKIMTVARVDTSRVERALGAKVSPPEVPERPKRAEQLSSLVILGASTGGPPALEKVFSGLDASLPAAYLIVQHLPAGFSAPLASRLSGSSGIPVAEAQEGQRIEPGRGYIAPYGRQMRIYSVRDSAPRVALGEDETVHGVCPAVDPLLTSAADEFDGGLVGVLLTGMGRDGVHGLGRVRAAGGKTIVQDEETSVVWGMPGAAVAEGVADVVAPLERIPVEIRRAIRGGVPSSVR
ncbi:MAG: chemotaxis response regulator protein-glutamate methylesterase [Coriobacteriia bacterium]